MNVEQEARAILSPNYGSMIIKRITTGAMATLIKEARAGKETMIIVPDKQSADDLAGDVDFMLYLHLDRDYEVRHNPYLAKFESGGRINVRVFDQDILFRGCNPHVILFDELDFDRIAVQQTKDMFKKVDEELRELPPIGVKQGIVKTFFEKRKASKPPVKTLDQIIEELEDNIKEGERILAATDKMTPGQISYHPPSKPANKKKFWQKKTKKDKN